MSAATLDFQTEGLRAMDFSLSATIAGVRISGFNIDEAQIEPLLRSSALLDTGTMPAKRVKNRRRLRLPWKRASALYQVTPLVTVALATTALVFPRLASSAPISGVTRTPIYHFQPAAYDEGGIADDTVTAAQIQALNELLALPLGAEADIHIDDWA